MKICRWKLSEIFDTLKLTLKNNTKEGSSTENIEAIPLLFRNEKKKNKKTTLTYYIFYLN